MIIKKKKQQHQGYTHIQIPFPNSKNWKLFDNKLKQKFEIHMYRAQWRLNQIIPYSRFKKPEL